MKKVSIFLVALMLITCLPIFSASAAGSYYLKGLQDGDYIVTTEEKSRVLTLVNEADKAIPNVTNATGVSKVEFMVDDVLVGTASEAPYQYELNFTDCASHELKYKIYEESGLAKEYGPFTYTTVAGKKVTELSFDEPFDTITDPASFVSLHGTQTAEITGGALTVKNGTSTAERTYMVGKEVTSGVIGDAAAKVFYYSMDLNFTETGYDTKVRLFIRGYEELTICDRKNTGILKENEVNQLEFIFDFNSWTAIVRKDGYEVNRIDISNMSNGSSAWLGIRQGGANRTTTIDNVRFSMYDLKSPNSFTASSIMGGENNPVETNIPEIRFIGDKYSNVQNFAKTINITPEAKYTTEIDGKEIVIKFTEDLLVGTTYTVTLDGVTDEDLLAYLPYSLCFRTLREGENPLPVVKVISPVNDERYYPNDAISLRATATDSNGAVSYVEFYADGVLIEGSRTEIPIEGNTYEYIWMPVSDSFTPVSITAVAEDDEGGKATSAAVQVLVLSRRYPEVAITSPANYTAYTLSLGGVVSEAYPVISFEASDSDGLLENIEIYVDDILDGTLENLEATSYVLSNSLAVGEHLIEVRATDNDGQTTTAEVIVRGEKYTKKYPGLVEERFNDISELAKWTNDGKAEFSIGALREYENLDGLLIKNLAGDATESSVSRSYAYSLSLFESITDVSLAFSETTAERKVTFGVYELATFTSDGEITYGGSKVSNYYAGKIYDISAVVDIVNLKMYVFLDGKLIADGISITEENFLMLAPVKVTQKSVSGVECETVVLSLGIHKKEKAIDSLSAKIDGAEPVDGISVTPESITVEIDGGVDTDTLDGGVKLINTESGKASDLKYSDGRFLINEVLKYGTKYRLVVLPSVRNLNGRGYSGVFVKEFTTQKKDVGVVQDAVKLEVTTEAGTEELTDLSAGELSANLKVDFSITESASKLVTVVCVVYEGSFMKEKFINENVMVNADNLSVNMPVSTTVTENTFIEVFVVDNLTDLNSVSDTIYRID